MSALGLALSWIPGIRAATGVDPAWLAIVFSGAPIIVGAAVALFTSLDVTADLLVSLAMLGALAIGEYFAAGEVAFIMALGGLLEEVTSQRAYNSVAKLLDSVPRTATVIKDGRPVVVDISEVQPDDVLTVKAGETIPVDGCVLEGYSSVDESAVTGESLPVEKREHDPLYAGTINQMGTLTMTATNMGESSTLATIVKLVKQAQESKAPVVRLADKWASILVCLVLGISAAVWLVTGQVVRAITVLVVFCPCALILATPTAVIASIGRAARGGILIKDGKTCESLGHVQSVLFDKTGTLTQGNVELLEAVPVDGVTKEHLLVTAAAVERSSSHVLSKAIVAFADRLGLDPDEATDTQMLPGMGVKGQVHGTTVVVGNLALMEDSGVTVNGAIQEVCRAEEEKGRTVVLVATDKTVLGALSLGDSPKPDGLQGVARLKAMGIGPIGMLTGDNERVAANVAAAVGIETYVARLLPQQKLEAIAKAKSGGVKVAMVGDGINDAPALAAADVGVAMGARGSSIAIETADVAIMSDRVAGVAEALDTGRRTLAVISQNIWAAIVINLVAVVLASTGTLTPVTGALWHNVGSVAVVLNSARLIRRPHAAPSPGTASAETSGQ